MTNDTEAAKHVVDVFSIGTVIGTLADILPSVAAIFTVVWTSIRIYETETVQRILRRRARKPGKNQE
ncbi:hypothetical protein UFOVP1302_16 [uncultured Caudovirales phage]|uniref:Uncharacterized protein n=1 Tax=uncultured Caudovirales phage TaxID=2100421 RepID=A0A6J5SD86_9CAUD|nr:hypothetical protein UFOVP895_19 [uncultured Caudovirales phage]CAB4181803.1 hypothetical protein UFOVP1070_67 [uncultured Caudovirales phage]CAB4195516.1 hypothetical protein UFOVP1302_16 [uncultured Caudovirales phage]CAB4211670.1 hypothetical protein UFOVP1416_15 [uncultured Caudovirales phage]